MTTPSHDTLYSISVEGDHLRLPEQPRINPQSPKLVQAYIVTDRGLEPVARPRLPHQFYRADLSYLTQGSTDGLLYFAYVPRPTDMICLKPEAGED